MIHGVDMNFGKGAELMFSPQIAAPATFPLFPVGRMQWEQEFAFSFNAVPSVPTVPTRKRLSGKRSAGCHPRAGQIGTATGARRGVPTVPIGADTVGTGIRLCFHGRSQRFHCSHQEEATWKVLPPISACRAPWATAPPRLRCPDHSSRRRSWRPPGRRRRTGRYRHGGCNVRSRTRWNAPARRRW